MHSPAAPLALLQDPKTVAGGYLGPEAANFGLARPASGAAGMAGGGASAHGHLSACPPAPGRRSLCGCRLTATRPWCLAPSGLRSAAL